MGELRNRSMPMYSSARLRHLAKGAVSLSSPDLVMACIAEMQGKPETGIRAVFLCGQVGRNLRAHFPGEVGSGICLGIFSIWSYLYAARTVVFASRWVSCAIVRCLCIRQRGFVI